MKREIVVGFSLGFNTSACVVSKEEGVLFAIQEERLINEKNTKKFPLHALIECRKFLEEKGYDLEEDIICFSYSHYQSPDIHDLMRHSAPELMEGIERQYDRRNPINNYMLEQSLVKSMLEIAGYSANKEGDPPLLRVNHHKAHAFCAYALSAFANDSNPTIVVTMDGFGDGESATISIANESTLSRCATLPLSASFGLVYQFVTGAFGMKEHQHEGKVTGLAARGDLRMEHIDFFNSLFSVFGGEMFIDWLKKASIPSDESLGTPITDFGYFLGLKERVYAFVNDQLNEAHDDEEAFKTKANIARALQVWCERNIREWIWSVIISEGMDKSSYNLCLAGGVFANVRINQVLKNNLPELNEIFVAPPMGDEGTSVGSAYAIFDLFGRLNECKFKKYEDMALGTEFTSKDAVKMLGAKSSAYRVKATHFGSRETSNKVIAKLIDEGKVVCLFRGRLEFGPRALLNRSILYNCREQKTNDWLNKRLGRTEYMPFAPFIKEEYLDSLFYDGARARNSLSFMTMTLTCTPEFIKDYPAATHVDSTARPQVVSKTHNPDAWDILDKYEEVSGEKALINTSFNLHGYPNIATMERAFHDWYASGLDVLVLEDVVIWNKRK